MSIAQADYAQNLNKKLRPDIKQEQLDAVAVHYRTYDSAATETIRLIKKPSRVLIDKKELLQVTSPVPEGWTWTDLKKGGVLIIKHSHGNTVTVYK